MDGEATNPREHELVENLGWVQRLALSLARDRDAADDLAQDVARVWLEKRPALADGPRGWLASVARKLALDRARAEVSRKSREHSAARPEGESYEVVERGARQRRVVEAVMQLAEPYRSTILYRYLDGLGTREVAERMNTNEATVRKRVERGLALLRERLDREFGSKSSAWAVLLLEPGLRSAVMQGVGIMSMKWIATAGALLLFAGLAWYLRGDSGTGPNEAIGGMGVVVPLEVAAAREQPAPIAETKLESTEEAARAAQPATADPAPAVPFLRGFLFVDELRGAPADLEIQHRVGNVNGGKGIVDAANATWSIEPGEIDAGILWVTSSATTPARIPVPAELWSKGGVFDLHLSAGRTLALTILDRETKRPLPGLEFQVSRSIVLERRRGSVSTDGNQTTHRTDEQGRALVTGIPLEGWVSVTIDFSTRERDLVMRDGASMRMRMQREPDWQTWLKKEQPPRLEQTVFVSAPLGEACASGQVPAWAIALAGSAEAVQVLARETTNESPQARGMPFLLPRDAQGRFELCANAPGTLAVWLEHTQSREHLSAETQVTFAQPGAQDPVTFRELEGKQVTLRFVHVPERGELQTWVTGKEGLNSSGSLKCQGADLTRAFTLSGDEQIQLSLRLGAGKSDKSGWTRQIKVDTEHEITIDLGGCERLVRLDCPEVELKHSEGSILFLNCEAGEANFDQSVVVLTSFGKGISPVHIPNGRWLYRFEDKDQVAVWGVVDVTTATQPSEELVLRPHLRLAPLAEIQPGIRFDEIEGVSLAKLPEKFRVANAKNGSERVALPIDAKYVTLEGK